MSLQYVILEHTVNGAVHFDLMLEVEGQERLRTLQLPRWPLLPGEEVGYTELPPHRRDYLTYEGEVSGSRGTVRRIEAGTWLHDGAALLMHSHAGGSIRLHILAPTIKAA